VRGPRLHVCGHFDRDDQITPIQDIVTLGCVAGQAMEIRERNPSFTRLPPHDHDRVHCDKSDRQIGRVGRDAGLRPSEDRVIAIEAVECRTAGAGVPFVAAAISLVSEIGTARALYDVAADRCHIA
jgi:hypothetical protein